MIECLGEYFINEAQREAKKKQEKKLLSKQRSLQKKSDKEQQFIPPSEDNDDGDDVHDKHGEITYCNSDDDKNDGSRNVALKGKKNAKRGSMDEDQETKKRSKKQRK
jgi:hypothetical protein